MWPRLRYCLPATCIPKKKAEKLDTMIKVALLPAMGINRNFPKKLIYGAVARGGLGLPTVYHSQGIAGVVQVKRFLGDNTSMTGRLLTACAEAIQVEIGSERWFFETDFAKYGPLASESKLKEVWRFCKEAGVDIRIQKPGLSIRRRGDRFIMDECIENFKRGQCVRLNKMRLFVKAVTWADVVTIDGRRISKRAWAGQAVEGRANMDWPNQGDLTRADLRIWRRMLTKSVCKIEDEEQIKRLVRNEIPPTLQTGLGWWLDTMKTGWEYCSGTQRLYQTERKQMLGMRK
jgi:hypothetical protein